MKIIVNNDMSRQKIIFLLIENQRQFLFLPRDPTGIYQKLLNILFIRHHANRKTQNLITPVNYSHTTKTQSEIKIHKEDIPI